MFIIKSSPQSKVPSSQLVFFHVSTKSEDVGAKMQLCSRQAAVAELLPLQQPFRQLFAAHVASTFPEAARQQLAGTGMHRALLEVGKCGEQLLDWSLERMLCGFLELVCC